MPLAVGGRVPGDGSGGTGQRFGKGVGNVHTPILPALLRGRPAGPSWLIAAFAESYADRDELDHRALVGAVTSGRLLADAPGGGANGLPGPGG